MTATSSLSSAHTHHTRIAILGTGFGGIGMAICLKKRGVSDFKIFEKANGIGGTWRENTYPGCACDIASHLYSFSFDQISTWTRTYASQSEILQYLKELVRKHDLEQRITFNTKVVQLRWIDSDQLWRIATENGDVYTAEIVISAVGGLHVPHRPEFDGIKQFDGMCFHSSSWPKDLDLREKKVAVVGTGASAIQIIPAIASQVSRLLVFQRTPPWVLPRHDKKVPQLAQWIFKSIPGAQHFWRNMLFVESESIALGFTVWPWLLGAWQRQSRSLLRRHIHDPVLRETLTPHYTMGCKRVLLSDDYYPALTQKNVSVVSSQITEIKRDNILTKDGVQYPVDTIVLATGFRPFNPVEEIDIRGRGGRVLSHEWAAGPSAFNGVLVHGYPNFFMLMGPNTGLGHNSLIFMIEAQIRYILSCIDILELRQRKLIEVRPESQCAFNESIQKRFQRTVWSSQESFSTKACNTWYRNPSGRLSALWPGFASSYWWRLRKADIQDFVEDSIMLSDTADGREES